MMNIENSGIHNKDLQDQFFEYANKVIEFDDIDGENYIEKKQKLLIYTIHQNEKRDYDLNCFLHEFGYEEKWPLDYATVSIVRKNNKKNKAIYFNKLRIENQKKIINYIESVIIQNL